MELLGAQSFTDGITSVWSIAQTEFPIDVTEIEDSEVTDIVQGARITRLWIELVLDPRSGC